MNKNSNLHKAKKAKADEFYTRLSDIEKECSHYKEHFKGKTILCNCDDPRVSNFFFYFSANFEHLGLKRLICTCYKSNNIDLFSEGKSEKAVYIVYEGDRNGNKKVEETELDIKELQGDGDFRSRECIELLKQADIVVTNPPFSLFREYVAQLVEYQKQFLIIGNMNAITYKETFPLIKENKVWLGCTSGSKKFETPPSEDEKTSKFIDKDGKCWQVLGNTCWFTNLEHSKRKENLILYKHYTADEYPHYDNFNAINVNRVTDIPCDYDGIMGVPISFLDKYNPKQFEIIWQASGNTRASAPKEILEELSYSPHREDRGGCTVVNGKRTYGRIFIRKQTVKAL